MDKFQLLPNIFITHDFGLWFKGESTYVIADLHLGYEAEARSEGAGYPSTQYPIIEKRLDEILRRYKPETLVVAGDIKHSLGRNRRQEWNEVNRLVDALESGTKLVLLRGNHDNFLTTILRRKGLELKASARVGGCLIAHGHVKAARKAKDWLVIGHEHPSMKVRDLLGASAGAPCFLWSSLERAIVLPAFSPIAFGRNVLSESAKPLSPMLKSFDSFEMAAVQEDGLLRFGKVASLVGGA